MEGTQSSSFIPHPVSASGPELGVYNSTHVVREVQLDPMAAKICTREVMEFQPTNAQFMEVLGPVGYVMIGLSTLAFFVLIVLYIDTIRKIRKSIPSERKFCITVVLSVYPVIGLCTYLGILFPKANVLMDISSQLYFALCMVQFFKLTMSYFGGETAFVTSLEGEVLPWTGLPCCCWPCCWPVCPKTPVNKSQVRIIRTLIYQHPFVQIIMTIIGLTLWKEGFYSFGDFSPFKGHVYVFTITTTSFLFALWAFITTFKASIPALRIHHYGKKILVFQLCLVFLRFQALIFMVILLPSGAIPCLPPISPSVYANTILCCLLLGQLVILSVLARHVYQLPMDEDKATGKGDTALLDNDVRETENGRVSAGDGGLDSVDVKVSAEDGRFMIDDQRNNVDGRYPVEV